ncbi:hypothetical protein COMNV_01017 [Commensalibacter sp. Nvir]|uniref:Hint domain-containing protein n=1 Tax=Commensalibacter sp. Nvir TaxID=3069817 RepID=UPI002D4D070B|nr:hypothetical protein COMNV_01017 [Commensalibacter sp. Nvir]
MKEKPKKLFDDNAIYTLEDTNYGVNNNTGKISYTWLDLAEYWWGGYLKLTLSGDIDQTTLDSDINCWVGLHTVHVNAKLWGIINALGFNNDTDSKFTFLALTNYLQSTLKSGTIIESPTLLIGGKFKNGDHPATININDGGTAEIKGQIIEALDHSTILIVNITNNSTFEIDRAHIVTGTFNIESGSTYIFGGESPDTDTVLSFLKTDGSTEQYTVTVGDVTYNNGNTANKTYYEQKFYNSTLKLGSCDVKILNNAVFFFDYNNTLEVDGLCKLTGNTIVGWNNNTIVVGSLFTLDDNSYLIASAHVDLGRYGFTGNGTLIVMGEYYDATSKTFKLSSLTLTGGGQLGTVYLGYDPQYENGLGGYDHTLSDSSLINPDSLYGVTATFSGSITLNGTLYLGGGTDSNHTVWNGQLTLNDATVITDGTASKGLIITTDGILTVGDIVDLGLLNLQGGQINLGSNDKFTVFNSSSGQLKATGNVTGTDLNISGGTLTFNDNLTLTGNISINAGILTVNGTFSDQNDTISVTGSGSINLANADNLIEIDINTSGPNTLGGNVVKLVLEQGNQGTTTLTGTSFNNIEANDGSLTVNNDETGNNLVVAGANVTFNNLTINNEISITAGHLTVKGTLKDKGDLLSVTGSGSVDIGNVDQLNEIDINTSGSNTLGGNVVKLVLEQGNTGQTTLTGSQFDTIQVGNGQLIVNSNEIGNRLTITGGSTTFNKTLTIGNVTIDAGMLKVQTLDYTGSTPFSVLGSGSVTIQDGNQINEVDINSSGTNTFHIGIRTLILEKNNNGITNLTLQYNSQSPVTNYETITIYGGTLNVNENIFYNTNLKLDNGQVTLAQNNVCSNVTLTDGNLLVNGSFTITNTFTITGGKANFKGSIKDSNKFNISGGQVSIYGTLDLSTNPLLVTGKGELFLEDSNLTTEIDIQTSGNNTLGGTVQTLILEQGNSGTTTLTGNTFGSITLDSGTLVASKEETGDTFILNNGTVTFTSLTINKTITLTSGKLIATTFNNNTVNTLVIGKNASVDITGGNLGNVSITGSLFDNYLGGTINTLAITNSNNYLTYLRDSTVTNIDLESASDLIILKTTSLTGSLRLKINTTLDIKGTLNYSGNSFTVQDQANLSFDGGTLALSSGKNIDISGKFNLTCNNGGIIELDNATSLDINNGMTVTGQLDLKGKGGSVTFNGEIIAGDYKSTITVDAGVTLTLNSGCDIKPTIVLDNNATLDIKDPHNTNVIIQFNDTTVGKILIKFDMQINSDQFAIDNQLKNFSQSSELDFTQLKYSDVTISKVYYKDGKIYIDYTNNNTPQDTKEIVLNNVNVDSTIYDGQVLNVIEDDNGGVLIETCFLSGSQIATPKGLTNIEHLKIGDEILTYNNNKTQKDEIIWIGKATCLVRPYLPDDQAGYPVCVRKNAIKENVPSENLFITAEHCLYIDSQFIPVRMMVNHRSIHYDKTVTFYEYYHIETKMHSVIMANGLLTESYLDTGNRKGFFKKNYSELGEIKPIKTWEHHAAAPLIVRRNIVEPLFHQINARAIQIGFKNCEVKKTLTNDPNIYLLVDNHKIIHKSHIEGQWYHFIIPANTTNVEIISRATRPCDSIGPYVDDRRWLGILVGQIICQDINQNKLLDFHLKNCDVKGWNELEINNPNCRWTKGKATINLKERNLNTTGVLSLQILSAGPYLIDNTIDITSINKSA